MLTRLRRVGGLWFVALAAAAIQAGCGSQDRPAPGGPPNPAQAAGPPTVPDGFVFRPTLETTRGTVSAGTAFVVELPGHKRPLVLTAIHLLGPSGGLQADVPARDVPKVVRNVTLQDCFLKGAPVAVGGEALLIADAAPLGKPGAAGDIVAFWAKEAAGLKPGRLAAASPAKGERVWLAAPVVGGAPPEQRLHAATVLRFEDGDCEYRFDNAQIAIRATSGAPILNAAGEVVAINLGGGPDAGGMMGVGNPVGKFRPHLERAAGGK